MSGRPLVAVVGAGISGLAAAHALVRGHGDAVEVMVLEGSDRVGGILHTSDVAGLPVDAGADAFLARVPDASDLATAVGLGEDLVAPATTDAWLWVGGRMRRLPAGTVLGVPRTLRSLARSGALGPRGLARAAVDLVRPGRPLTGDAAVADVVAARLGRRVVDRLVDPLLGGVYAGRAATLSLEATAPQVAAAARAGGSLMRAMRAAAGAGADAAGDAGGPVFRSVEGGLGRLPLAVAARLGDRVRCSTRAALVERVGSGWRITQVGGRALVVDGIVIATPAPAAARLLRFAAPDVSAELAAIETASVAIVTLAFPRGALRGAPPGSGFLVPATEGRLVKACTFSSAKWAALGRGDVSVVRCSVGRSGEPPPVDDDQLVAAVLAELHAAIGVTEAPVEVRVTRWVDALPQYAVGHLERVARITAGLDQLPGLALAGSAYDGVGVPACIRSGERAAGLVARTLVRAPRE